MVTVAAQVQGTVGYLDGIMPDSHLSPGFKITTLTNMPPSQSKTSWDSITRNMNIVVIT